MRTGGDHWVVNGAMPLVQCGRAGLATFAVCGNGYVTKRQSIARQQLPVNGQSNPTINCESTFPWCAMVIERHSDGLPKGELIVFHLSVLLPIITAELSAMTKPSRERMR